MSSGLRLYLIRHGETEWSILGQHTGRTEIPLTPRGEEDARKLGHYLQTISFTRVFSSPLQRAQRTCELAGLGHGVTIDADLAEWDYGDYEGKRSAEIRQTRPDWTVFRDGCPGGETPAQVSDRVDRLLSRLSELDGNIAVFSHGHLGCSLATRWIGLPIIEAQHFALDPASFSLLGYARNQQELRVIARWNVSPAVTYGKV